METFQGTPELPKYILTVEKYNSLLNLHTVRAIFVPCTHKNHRENNEVAEKYLIVELPDGTFTCSDSLKALVCEHCCWGTEELQDLCVKTHDHQNGFVCETREVIFG